MLLVASHLKISRQVVKFCDTGNPVKSCACAVAIAVMGMAAVSSGSLCFCSSTCHFYSDHRFMPELCAISVLHGAPHPPLQCVVIRVSWKALQLRQLFLAKQRGGQSNNLCTLVFAG